MAVTRGNGGKRPGSGGGRARPDFTPSKNKKLFLKLDCVAGRVKIVGHESGELFSRTAVFNADLENIKTGWLDFNANAESSIVGDDRDNPPPGAGERDGPKWGIELPVAMPYSTRFDDIDIKKVDPCLIKSSTGLLLEAVATLWDAYDEAKHKDGDVAVVEVAGWESGDQVRRQEIFQAAPQAPRFCRRISRRPSRASATTTTHD